MPADNNGWLEYKLLVLARLDSLEKINDSVHELRTEMAMLKLKVAVIGAIAGILGSTILGYIVESVLTHFIH